MNFLKLALQLQLPLELDGWELTLTLQGLTLFMLLEGLSIVIEYEKEEGDFPSLLTILRNKIGLIKSSISQGYMSPTRRTLSWARFPHGSHQAVFQGRSIMKIFR